MKRAILLSVMLLAAAPALAPMSASAQSNAPTGVGDNSAQGLPSGGHDRDGKETTGAAPKDIGTAGSPVDPVSGKKVIVNDEAAAKTQPDMATGEDLKGPPKKFAPSKTPE